MFKRFANPLVVDAGMLVHVIQIQQPTATDALGGQSGPWVTILSPRAAIATASSREAYQAKQFVAEVSHVITIRWPGASVNIQGGKQVLFGARVFKLQAVENVIERNRVLLLHCLEINGGQ